MQGPAVAPHDLVGTLVVHDPAAGPHPLRLPGAHAAEVAQAVLVSLPAFQQQGQGFDARVGMGRGALGLAGPHVDGAEMVEEDERANSFEPGPGNGAADFEAIPFQGAEGRGHGVDGSGLGMGHGEAPFVVRRS